MNVMIKLANKLANKYAEKDNASYKSKNKKTIDLFFYNLKGVKGVGNEYNNFQTFQKLVYSEGSLPYAVLSEFSNKTNQDCSFDLKAFAENKEGAQWQLSVNPAQLKGKIYEALDQTYQKTCGATMREAQAYADVEAKKGNLVGNPTLQVASMSSKSQ
jgi:hypothetical protein